MNKLFLNTLDPTTGQTRYFDLDQLVIQDNMANEFMLLVVPLYVGDTFKRKEFLYGRNQSPVRRKPNGDLIFQYLTTPDAVRKWNGFEYALVEGDYQRDENGNLIQNPEWATGKGEYDFVQDTPLTGPYGAAKIAQASQIIIQLDPLGRYDA